MTQKIVDSKCLVEHARQIAVLRPVIRIIERWQYT